MRYKAEKYQLEGIKFICRHPYCGLFADPGTGKTGMTLAAFTALKKAGIVKRALVIAPRLVVYNVWPKEIKKFDQFKDLSINIIHGENKDVKIINELMQPNHDLTITNPESLKWFFSMLTKKWFTRKTNPLGWPWDMLIIDESSKFKNHGAIRFKVLKPYLELFKKRVILTGTPTPNTLQDLWSQMYIVDEGQSLGGTLTAFRSRWFQIDNPKFYTYKLLPNSENTIYRAIAPKIIRFDETLFKLPERIVHNVVVSLKNKAQDVYTGMEKQLIAEIDNEEITAPNASSKYLLCRQIANGCMYDPDTLQPDGEIDGRKRKRVVHKIHTEKLEALDNILDELQGKPALISYYFRHDLDSILTHLKKRYKKEIMFIGSGVSVSEVNTSIELWNRGQLPVLIVHPASMAHGLNLQAGGNDIIFYSLTDNLEDYQQLIKRLHRRGVVGQVRVHRIVADKTIDMAVLKRLDDKAINQKTLLDYIKEYNRETTNSMLDSMQSGAW